MCVPIMRITISGWVVAMHSLLMQEEVCKEQVEWAKAEKRTFLRQRIELRLASLSLESKNFADSLSIVGT